MQAFQYYYFLLHTSICKLPNTSDKKKTQKAAGMLIKLY